MAKADPALEYIAPNLIGLPAKSVSLPLTEGGKIRVGIISMFLTKHSIGTYVMARMWALFIADVY